MAIIYGQGSNVVAATAGAGGTAHLVFSKVGTTGVYVAADDGTVAATVATVLEAPDVVAWEGRAYFLDAAAAGAPNAGNLVVRSFAPADPAGTIAEEADFGFSDGISGAVPFLSIDTDPVDGPVAKMFVHSSTRGVHEATPAVPGAGSWTTPVETHDGIGMSGHLAVYTASLWFNPVSSAVRFRKRQDPFTTVAEVNPGSSSIWYPRVVRAGAPDRTGDRVWLNVAGTLKSWRASDLGDEVSEASGLVPGGACYQVVGSPPAGGGADERRVWYATDDDLATSVRSFGIGTGGADDREELALTTTSLQRFCVVTPAG